MDRNLDDDLVLRMESGMDVKASRFLDILPS